MKRNILVSVHDVTPRHAERLKEIDALLSRFGLKGRYSMLVVPNYWGAARLDKDTHFCDWLRQRAAEGVEMILHGFFHCDTLTHHGDVDRPEVGLTTASQGEFLRLDRSEACRRLEAGKAMLEQVLGRKVNGFVAPAWFYGDGARMALADVGFRFAEDHWTVWRPDAGNAIVTRGPVIGYASRSVPRIASSLLWSNLARGLLAGQDTLRFALHPHDFDVAALRREINRSLGWFMRRRRPMLYRELLDLRAATSAA